MERLLDDAKRLILAWPGRTVPLLAPMAFWWDGQHVWFSTASTSLKAESLAERPACALYVSPIDEQGQGRLLRGTARVFGLADPVGLAVHGGLLAAAQTALMVKNAPSILGYVADATKIPKAFLPTNRVLIRVTVDDQMDVRPPEVGKGIAPPLPTQVPPEVRRIIGSRRRVVLATQIDGGLGLMPAVWGAGFSLRVPDGLTLVEDSQVTVVVDHDPGFRPTEVAGVSLTGTIATGGPSLRLVPTKVRWWSGFDLDTAELSGSRTDMIVIPD